MKTNKQMKDELTGIDIRDYYHSLSKAQKGELLRYAVSQLGIGYSTMVNKLAGRLEFTKPELISLNLAIEQKEI